MIYLIDRRYSIGEMEVTLKLFAESRFDTSSETQMSLNAYNAAWVAFGPRQANLVLIAYASSEGSGEPAHPRSLARTFAARSYKQ